MTRQIANHVLLALLLAALVACGKSPESKPSSSGASPRTGVKSGALTSATAAEVAKEGRDKIRCPAKIKSPSRPRDAPVDDVVGVRPGMTYEEAANVVMCTHDLLVAHADTSRRFNIETHGQTIRQGFSARFAEPRVERTSKQIMQDMQADFMARSGNAARQDMKPGQSKWYVSTMGMPGQERVIAAAREEWFEEGRNPTMAGVEQALLKKYGTPTRNQQSGDSKLLTWAHDPFGRLVTETSPLFHQCHGNADPDAGTNFSPDCGIVVAAAVHPTPENPGLGRYLQVSVLDQSNGYEALMATEQALQQMESDRKAKEIAAAAKNADAPEL
jgi:hypothetical protein